MKKTNILLAAAMAALLCACSDSTAQTEKATDPVSADTVAGETQTEAVYPYAIADLGGEMFTILNCEDELWTGTNHIMDFEEQTGEAVEDAIYLRARDTEDKFNTTLKIDKVEMTQIYSHLQKTVMAGDAAYDAAYTAMSGFGEPLKGKFGINLYDVETLHFDEPWWNQTFLDSATVFDDTLYASIDYANLMGYAYCGTFVFNMDMMRKFDLTSPYDLVREGKWTYESMREYLAAVVNLNGDTAFTPSEKTENAVYGLVVQHEASMSMVLMSGGETFIQMGADGVPKLREDLTKIETAFSTLENVLKTAGYVNMKNGNSQAHDGSGAALFTEGRALFYVSSLGACGSSWARDLSFEYGLLPMPKAAESQESYYSPISQYTLALVIPKSAKDPEKTGKVIDYMSWYATQHIIPELQVSLCYKGLRDEDSIEMMEIIQDSLYLDAGYIYDWTKTLMNNLAIGLVKGDMKFASNVERVTKTIDKSIAKTMEALTENE